MVDHIIPPRTALDGLTLNTKEKPKEYHRLFWDPKNHRAVCKSCNSAKAATLDRYLHARG